MFKCEACNFNTTLSNNYARHCATKKHCKAILIELPATQPVTQPVYTQATQPEASKPKARSQPKITDFFKKIETVIVDIQASVKNLTELVCIQRNEMAELKSMFSVELAIKTKKIADLEASVLTHKVECLQIQLDAARQINEILLRQPIQKQVDEQADVVKENIEKTKKIKLTPAEHQINKAASAQETINRKIAKRVEVAKGVKDYKDSLKLENADVAIQKYVDLVIAREVSIIESMKDSPYAMMKYTGSKNRLTNKFSGYSDMVSKSHKDFMQQSLSKSSLKMSQEMMNGVFKGDAETFNIKENPLKSKQSFYPGYKKPENDPEDAEEEEEEVIKPQPLKRIEYNDYYYRLNEVTNEVFDISDRTRLIGNLIDGKVVLA